MKWIILFHHIARISSYLLELLHIRFRNDFHETECKQIQRYEAPSIVSFLLTLVQFEQVFEIREYSDCSGIIRNLLLLTNKLCALLPFWIQNGNLHLFVPCFLYLAMIFGIFCVFTRCKYDKREERDKKHMQLGIKRLLTWIHDDREDLFSFSDDMSFVKE